MDRPTPGQDYFKLPLDAALAQLLSQQIQLKRPFDAELAGFFETWLDGQYRRGDDEGELSHLLCFPVLHLPRGELAGLVRCGVRLRFGSGEGKAFRAPSRAERARASYPQVPDEVRLTRAPRAEGAWPFFIDSRLLRQPLGVSAESIDALFEALRTLDTVSEQQMLALLTTTLERSASGTRAEATADADQVTVEAARLKACVAAERCAIETWLARLTSALRHLLGQSASRAQVYPVGIVVDGTQAKTTWHLQRELNALLDAEPDQSWKLSTPLGAYLTGRARPAGEAPQRALFPGPALSQSQRAAAEHFWGSSFSAVQGPPGTGKTSLILHLCAEALVRQVEPLLDGGRMGNELFVIASSNNRAVDNVIEPLTSGDGLPLALRAGSRQVCEQQLAHGLRRTLAWLKRAELEPLEQRGQALIEASRHFQSRRAEIERRLAPRREAQQRRAARAQLERALEASSTASEPASTHARSLATLSAEQMSALSAAIAKVEKRLHGLSRLCEAEPTSAQLEALGRHYKRTTARHLPELVQALSNAQLTFELPLPPPMPAQPVGAEQLTESWEEATELCLGRLGELRSSLERAEILAKSLQEQNRLRAELAALGAPELPVPEVEEHETLSRELFHAAVGLREAWASQSAVELGKAVSTALRTVEQERSLRPLFRNELQAVRALCRLFGIWGSTLLSLGNCFPSESSSIARLVIDEAGQCHPAHAVSALMRTDAALVIGDVNQLTPVIELSTDDEARLFQAGRFKTPAPKLLPYRIHEGAQISTQSLSDRAVDERRTLVDHFRCQPEIIAISDRLCRYGLTVHTERADRSRNAAYLATPVGLVDVRGEQARLAGSWCNELELNETLALVESLIDCGVRPDEIAVITPYRGQLERLRREFAERRIPLEYSAELVESGRASGHQRVGVALGTVHRFQGGERSVVLFSSVVSQPGSLSFLNARPNLLNVAVSRAQHHFVCLGHAPVLAQGERTRWLTEGVHRLSPADYNGPWRLRPR